MLYIRNYLNRTSKIVLLIFVVAVIGMATLTVRKWYMTTHPPVLTIGYSGAQDVEVLQNIKWKSFMYEEGASVFVGEYPDGWSINTNPRIEVIPSEDGTTNLPYARIVITSPDKATHIDIKDKWLMEWVGPETDTVLSSDNVSLVQDGYVIKKITSDVSNGILEQDGYVFFRDKVLYMHADICSNDVVAKCGYINAIFEHILDSLTLSS